MRKYIFLLVCFFTPNLIFSIDSLELTHQLQQIENAPDTQKIRLLNNLSWELRRNNNSKAKDLAEKGIQLALAMGDSINFYNLNANLGVIFSYRNKYDIGIQLIERSLAYFQKTKNEEREAKTLQRFVGTLINFGDYQRADSILVRTEQIYLQLENKKELMAIYVNKGVNYRKLGRVEEAKKSYHKSLEIGQELKDKKVIAISLLNLGTICQQQTNYLQALEYYLKSSEVGYEDDFINANLFNNIGIVYGRIEELGKAIDYHQKALLIWQKLGLSFYASKSLNNIGLIYFEQLNYGDALTNFKKALNIIEKIEGTNNNLSGILNNIGGVYLALDEYKTAETYYLRALKISQETKNDFDISRNLKNLAEVNRKLGINKKAIEYGKRSLEIAETINFPYIAQSSSLSISDSYLALKDYKKAFDYKNKYWEIRDTILGGENKRKIVELELKYETAKKENDLKIKNDQVKSLEEQKTIDRLKIWVLILTSSLMAFVIGLLGYNYLKGKRKLKDNIKYSENKISAIQEQKNQLEKTVTSQQDQLNNYLQQLIEKSDLLVSLKNELNNLSDDTNTKLAVTNINELLNQNLQSKESRKKFEHYFSMVHKDFFKDLIKTFPNLTSNDLNLSALIKLNLNNKEISQVMGISPSSVKKARQRLYQKMNLPDNDSLRKYIIQL